MRQICTSRKVWLPILLLFTAVFIFACWDRGVSIDFDGNGYLCTVPNDGTAEEVPVSFTARSAAVHTPAAATSPAFCNAPPYAPSLTATPPAPSLS